MVACAVLLGSTPAAEAAPQSRVARAVASEDLATWSATIGMMTQRAELHVRQIREDNLIEGRVHSRLAQFYNNVPVFGGELAVQSDDRGHPLTVFGTLYQDLDIDVAPALSADQARSCVERLGGSPWGSQGEPVLTILPKD